MKEKYKLSQDEIIIMALEGNLTLYASSFPEISTSHLWADGTSSELNEYIQIGANAIRDLVSSETKSISYIPSHEIQIRDDAGNIHDTKTIQLKPMAVTIGSLRVNTANLEAVLTNDKEISLTEKPTHAAKPEAEHIRRTRELLPKMENLYTNFSQDQIAKKIATQLENEGIKNARGKNYAKSGTVRKVISDIKNKKI